MCEVDGDKKLLRLGIDIADINTTLVGEQNPVALIRVSASVHLFGVFCLFAGLWAGVVHIGMWFSLRSSVTGGTLETLSR